MEFDTNMIIGFAITAVFLLTFAVQFLINSKNLTIWHGLALGAGSFFLITMINNHTDLVRWVDLGVNGLSLPAFLFVIGMLAMTAVMAYNFITTRGERLVR